MSGKRIRSRQIRWYMETRQSGKSQKVAAAIAGFSERSGRNVEKRSFETAKSKRNWKTRIDPFHAVWKSELVPLLEKSPGLEARTLLEELQKRYDGQYPDSLLRTLQRRVRQWKALEGPDKEVIFRQKVPPGWQSISDFTHADELGVTIRGEPFSHLIYHFRLSFSGWEYAQIVQGGESYTALAEGMQNAFWSIFGVTETHRTDSLSAAYKNLPDKEKEEFTESYLELCAHYGIQPTRNNKGVSHENGSIESPNGHLKNRIDQALLLRGSRDFHSLDDYRALLRDLMHRSNRRIAKRVAEERPFLKPLPERKACDYTEERIRVTSSSTISIKKVTYSVPSRLRGMLLKVHVYDDRLECFVDGNLVEILKRLRFKKGQGRRHNIDYHHVIQSLIQKPQAFRHYIYQESLFPTLAFKQTWELFDQQLDERQACREYVKILYQAAQTESDSETRVNRYLEECLINQRLPTSVEVRKLFNSITPQPPVIKESVSNLSDYDLLLGRQGDAP